MIEFEQLFPLRFCLNLDRRPDRWGQVSHEFAKASLEVTRWAAIDGTKVRNAQGYALPSRYAVGMSKRLAVRHARHSGAEGVFIFEDDVIFDVDWRGKFQKLEIPADWGIFLLGCQHISRPIPVAPGLVRVTAAVDNHAVGIRRTWYDRVLFKLRRGREDAKIWPHTASDRHLAALMREIPTYAAWPNLAWQREAVSDQTGQKYSYYGPTGNQLTNGGMLQNIGAVWGPCGDHSPLDQQMGADGYDYLKSVLRPGMKVCEFGGSRATWELSPHMACWHTIEHREDQFRRMATAPAAVRRHFIPPEWPGGGGEEPAQSGQYRRYIGKLAELNQQFDVILLAGRSRVDCALAASHYLRPDGWLFFNDFFSREQYFQRSHELVKCYRMVKDFPRSQKTLAVFRGRADVP